MVTRLEDAVEDEEEIREKDRHRGYNQINILKTALQYVKEKRYNVLKHIL